MRALYTILDTAEWYILCTVSLVLLVGSVTMIIWSYGTTGRKMRILLGVNTLMNVALFVALMDCARYLSVMEKRFFSAYQLYFFQVPCVFYVGVVIVSGCLFLFSITDYVRRAKESLSPDAIKQAVDTLPAGISVSDRKGAIRLANLKMNKLCEEITGELYINAKNFWKKISEVGKEQNGQILVRAPQSEVWLFQKENISTDGEEYEQITAINVTEQYDIIDELEAMNEHLQDVQKRMKDVSDLSADMFVAKEKADARAALHNQLGQVLLMGRHYLNHQDTIDPKIVYAATVQMNQFLLGEAMEPYQGEDDVLTQAVAMSAGIGVRVEIKGDELRIEPMRSLLGQAITECAANTVKHAEGDRVMVWSATDANGTKITITNNGRPPKGPITESGGLLSLRRKVEATGGKMELECNDAFVLKLFFSGKQE